MCETISILYHPPINKFCLDDYPGSGKSARHLKLCNAKNEHIPSAFPKSPQCFREKGPFFLHLPRKYLVSTLFIVTLFKMQHNACFDQSIVCLTEVQNIRLHYKKKENAETKLLQIKNHAVHQRRC